MAIAEKETVAARAARGAALLDRLRPDWIRIQPYHIDFTRIDRDPLALYWGNYWRGLYVVREGSPFDPIAHGFSPANESTVEYEQLNAAWRAELAQRKERVRV